MLFRSMNLLDQEISSIELCTKFLNRFLSISSVDDLIKETEIAFEELLPMEYSGLYLFNEKKQKLELKMAHGFSLQERLEAEKTAHHRHPGYVFRTGESIDVPDVDSDKDNLTYDSKRSFEVKCRLYKPIYSGNKIIGC